MERKIRVIVKINGGGVTWIGANQEMEIVVVDEDQHKIGEQFVSDPLSPDYIDYEGNLCNMFKSGGTDKFEDEVHQKLKQMEW